MPVSGMPPARFVRRCLRGSARRYTDFALRSPRGKGVREFNPCYAEAEGALLGKFSHFHIGHLRQLGLPLPSLRAMITL